MKLRHNNPLPPAELISIQNWLQNAITKGKFNSKEAIHVIRESNTRSSDERISTYLDDYWPRCFESLTEDYPRTARTLGDRWEPLCANYLRSFPSDRFTLYYLGRNLPKYVATLSLKQWVKDLINLEWAFLKASIFQKVPFIEITDTTPLYIQPHTSLVHLNYPITALMTENPCKKQPESVMVYDSSTPDSYTVLPLLIARVFNQFEQGRSLSETFDILSQSNLSESELDDIASQIQHWMSVAIQSNWITPSLQPKE